MKELTSKNSLLKILAMLVTGVVLWSLSPGRAGLEEGYGILSLLPAAVAIVLAFLIRNVLAALFLAIVTGGLVSGKINIIQAFLLPAIGSAQYGLILLVYLWSLGGLLGIWTRTGGAQAFAEWAARWLVQGRRSAKFFAWLMGVVFHQGGTISTVLAGTTVRPVTDKERVSHEELSYIVDSTASPVAGLIPLNIWPTYVAGLVVGTIPLLPDEASAVSFFYRSIPLNFYAIFAVLMPLFFSLEILPWRGRKMGLAIGRVRTTGELNAPEALPLSETELIEIKTPAHYQPSVLDFLVPVTTLIGCSLGSYFLTGSVLIAEAFGLSVVVAALLAYLRGLRISEVVEAMVLGCKGVTTGVILLGLAITLSHVSEELGTAAYIVEMTSGWMVPLLFPALLLVICMVVSFSTGTSFGTYAVIFPLALPLAWSIAPDPNYLLLCFASVMGGSIFGDQCSPISDTTILSSLACGADLMDHVKTQLPLAVVAAVLAAVASTVAAIFILF